MFVVRNFITDLRISVFYQRHYSGQQQQKTNLIIIMIIIIIALGLTKSWLRVVMQIEAQAISLKVYVSHSSMFCRYFILFFFFHWVALYNRTSTVEVLIRDRLPAVASYISAQ